MINPPCRCSTRKRMRFVTMRNVVDQLFARKLIRPFSDLTQEDIDNEVKAVTKLCSKGENRNIVAVLKHGRLENSTYYFLDMELCDLNLETFIYSESFPGFEKEFGYDSRSSKETRYQTMWPIMLDIVHGLQFIHHHDQVHRDLKPRNSKS